jgi:ferrous iron transport protein B
VPVEETQREVRRILDLASSHAHDTGNLTEKIDHVVLHPVAGPLLLAAIMFLVFQAVFSWANVPMDLIKEGVDGVGQFVTAHMGDGLLRSLLVEGILGGVGSVLVFLPQILILFFFILILEDCGYLPRAAFLLDRVMGGVGLSGRAFIPLLSSFACAIPGIMATRTIQNPRDRLVTIMIAPLMTCSARLPVYALVIGAFIPNEQVGGIINLQGLVLFCLYIGGIGGAMLAALVLRRTVARGESGGFMMEMPKYQLPNWRDVAIGLWQRAWIFLRRAGTLIMAATVLLWALLSFPNAPAGQSQVEYSAAGRIATVLQHVVKPIGFNHEIALAIIPAMAAREVAVSALATVYSIESDDEAKTEQSLVQRLQGRWPLPTALAFLMWFVFAPQCVSTIAVIRRETNGWRWPMFSLAYLAAGATYWTATALGL